MLVIPVFIKEILLRNNILDEYMGSTANTICSICGASRKNTTSPLRIKTQNTSCI